MRYVGLIECRASSFVEELYSPIGRNSIPPERLLIERIGYDLLLFRWFVGAGIEAGVWDATTFAKNCGRLLAGERTQKFLARHGRA